MLLKGSITQDHVTRSWTLRKVFLQSVILQWSYTRELLTHTIFIATSLKPLSSNRWIILPTRPRCTPSGFTMIKVRSLFSAMINLQIICSKVEMEHTTMRCLTSREWTRTRRRETRGKRREAWRRWGRARRDVPVRRSSPPAGLVSWVSRCRTEHQDRARYKRILSIHLYAS